MFCPHNQHHHPLHHHRHYHLGINGDVARVQLIFTSLNLELKDLRKLENFHLLSPVAEKHRALILQTFV